MTRRPLVTPRNDSPAIVEAERAVGRMVIEIAAYVRGCHRAPEGRPGDAPQDGTWSPARVKEIVMEHTADAVLWGADLKTHGGASAMMISLFGVES